jgi:hypothetical protein
MRTILKININSVALVVLSAACGLVSRTARADRRAYGETYEAVTAAQGELDVESWTTFAGGPEVPNGPTARGLRQMVELEYGLTDRWDVAVYNMLDVLQGAGTNYAGLKLESRFRLSLPGEWPVDPVLYFEYQRLLHSDASYTFEGKLIVAKDVGPWNFATNVSLEVEHRVDGGGLRPEMEFAVGVSRELGSPRFKFGVEAFGKLEKSPDAGMLTTVWGGPAVSVALRGPGFMRGLWLTLAAGHGLTQNADVFYGRATLGLQF